MKKRFLCLLLSVAGFLGSKSYAQNVAINEDGSAANPNAILDVKSFTKGVLLPRTSTTARLAMPNVKGMLVFDSTAGSFFYNTGAGWQNMTPPASSPGAAWLLNGNASIDSNSFLGTTDAKQLTFKVNNQFAGRIEAANQFNMSLGFKSGGFNSNGSPNTAIGAFAMNANTTGGFNTALGSSALKNNTTGNFNTAVGFETLVNSSKGDFNTAVGSSAMQKDTTGFHNTAVGQSSLRINTSGSQNTAIGSGAMFNNNGNENTALGEIALFNNTTGSQNTAIGEGTLLANNTGSGNTAIGYRAGPPSGLGNLTNATAIGFFASVNASNKVRIGNSGVTVIEGQVPFTTPSDGRFKYQVKEDVKGLDFIMQLRPVTYRFDVKRFDEQQSGNGSVMNNGIIQASYNEASAIRRTGFIAQEVEKAANASGYDFSGIIKPKTDQEHYGLSYESFVVPLVKAMQEQQQIIADLQKQVAELKQQVQHSK